MKELIGGFFALAAAVVSAILGPWFSDWRKERKQKKLSKPLGRSEIAPKKDLPAAPAHGPASVEPAVVKGYVREGLPSEVVDSVNATPPLAREAFADQVYHGRWVRWRGTVTAIHDYGETINVGLRDESPRRIWTFVDFSPAHRHQLEGLREGDTIVYEARITRAWKHNDVKLEDGRILEHHCMNQ